MASYNWIELRCGTQHESSSPVIIEHRQAYKLFDQQAFQPRLILSIGGMEKRKFYHKIGLDERFPHGAGILFRPVQLATLILDCELHNQTRLEGTLGQYPYPGEQLVLHPLQCPLTPHSPSHKFAQFALDMYWQVLFPFASTILLFLDDLGGAGPVIEILVSWARRARRKAIPAPPRVLIVCHWRNRTEIATFESRLRIRLMCAVSDDDAIKGTINDEMSSPINLPGENAFESVRLIPDWNAASEFWRQTESSFAVREDVGYGFSSEHLKYLLPIAIRQFGQSVGHQIDLQQAVRSGNLPSPQLAETLVRFILKTMDADVNHVLIIASALDLDAHPPGMHCKPARNPTNPVANPFTRAVFPPHLTFDKNYKAALCKVERSVNKESLSNQVRDTFVQVALDRQDGSSARAHLRLLREFQPAWRQCAEKEFCFVCLARRGSTELDCGHQLCDSCVTICRSWEGPTNSPNARLMQCPLCGQHYGKPILLRPSTSGNRVLELGGRSQSKWEMIKFLKDLESLIRLPLPLRERFDLVIGSGIGTLSLPQWVHLVTYLTRTLLRPNNLP